MYNQEHKYIVLESLIFTIMDLLWVKLIFGLKFLNQFDFFLFVSDYDHNEYEAIKKKNKLL